MAREALISSEKVFEGKLINVRVDTVRLAGGRESIREVVEHPGAVAVLPVLPTGDLVLVRQYRHAIGRSILEVPAGTREVGEPVEATARRELVEETGYQATDLRELVRFFVSPGWADEELIVYLAQDVQAGTARPEDDEDIEVVAVAPGDIPSLIAAGAIADSKTIVSLLAWLGMRLSAE